MNSAISRPVRCPASLRARRHATKSTHPPALIRASRSSRICRLCGPLRSACAAMRRQADRLVHGRAVKPGTRFHLFTEGTNLCGPGCSRSCVNTIFSGPPQAAPRGRGVRWQSWPASSPTKPDMTGTWPLGELKSALRALPDEQAGRRSLDPCRAMGFSVEESRTLRCASRNDSRAGSTGGRRALAVILDFSQTSYASH